MVSSMGFNGVFGFSFHDTCGVNNLHGIPGILGGIAGIVMTMVIGDDPAAASVFWAMDPVNDDGREKGTQAGMQAACLAMVFIVSLISGAIAGSVAKGMASPSPFFHDDYHFTELGDAALKKDKKEKKVYVKNGVK